MSGYAWRVAKAKMPNSNALRRAAAGMPTQMEGTGRRLDGEGFITFAVLLAMDCPESFCTSKRQPRSAKIESCGILFPWVGKYFTKIQNLKKYYRILFALQCKALHEMVRRSGIEILTGIFVVLYTIFDMENSKLFSVCDRNPSFRFSIFAIFFTKSFDSTDSTI